MQVVVTELCASLIFPWADALAANPAIDNAAKNRMVSPRMNTATLLFPLARNIRITSIPKMDARAGANFGALPTVLQDSRA